MNGLTAVLFDVDGTLVDTNYLHVVCWWEAFGQAGFDVPMARIHRAIGMGSDQLLDALLPEDRDRDEDGSVRAAHSALYATYWSRQRPLRGARAAVYDGPADLLTLLPDSILGRRGDQRSARGTVAR